MDSNPPPEDRASRRQLLASNPDISAFVSAHAGTGKTKLLIDRLLRLMLTGADPARILCLTYTRAAAAEMAIRLQKKLGAWVTLDEAALREALLALNLPVTRDLLDRARALFGRVLDVPGGMRISTVHAFCQSLLRRFPLEANISPHFRVVEGAEAAALTDAAREAVLPALPEPLLARLAGCLSEADLRTRLADLTAARDRLSPVLAWPEEERRAALRRAAGLETDDAEQVLREAVAIPDEQALRIALRDMLDHGAPSFVERAETCLAWLALESAQRAARWAAWTSCFLTEKDAPRAPSKLFGDKLAKSHAHIGPALLAEQARVAAVEDHLRAARMVDATDALLTLAAAVTETRSTHAARTGALEYDDLVRLTQKLLHDPGAAWVLFKLDGGLDHLLLDEVQDMSDPQWRLAAGLAAEFFAGAGARDTPRTIFAVGDTKQSIYSFQGAEPAAFAAWQAHWQARVAATDPRLWHTDTLDVSFRSTEAVLRLVDAVFAPGRPAAGGVTVAPLRHLARRKGQAGAVELWPAIAPPPRPETPAWSIPEQNATERSAAQQLVDAVANRIRAELVNRTILESEDRPLRPADFLILLRKRSTFARAMVHALKAAGIPVAGQDRMTLTGELAVADLLSLGHALLLPEDDLSLAEFLVSPFGGLDDDGLAALAIGRNTSLFSALAARAGERPDWSRAYALFAALLARADYATPFALFSEALDGGGRARILARFGTEAAEPIAEFLSAALAHERAHAPSLTGFLHALERADAEIKREPEAAGDAVRVMTVHAAKGLEAPVVILPDTIASAPDRASLRWTEDPASGAALPLWTPGDDYKPAAAARLAERDRAACREEENRLLYVALTRARDRLIIGGADVRGRNTRDPECWYEKIAAGFAALDGVTADETGLLYATPQTAPPERAPTAPAPADPFPLPPWAGSAPSWLPAPPAPEPRPPRPLAPSRPEGVVFGATPAHRSPLDRPDTTAAATAAARGTAIHALLRLLPDLPPEARAPAAGAELARAGFAPEDAAQTADTLLALLADPALAPLFGPGSRAEQPVAGIVGPHVITGQVDRLAATDTTLWIADYKTGRTPPPTPDATPIPYLRQIAAYRAVLAPLFPALTPHCVLLWTDIPAVTHLPPALLDQHTPA